MKHKLTFKEVAQLWEADRKQFVKRSTSAAYSLRIHNHLLPAFGAMTDITEEKVQAFVMEKLDSGMGRRSVRDLVMVLKMILRFGAKHKMTEYRQIDIRFPTEREKSDIEVLSRNDQKKIMNYLSENVSSMNLGIYICLSSGLRIGEICALKWEDIDMRAGVIRIRKTLQRIYIIDEGRRHTEIIIGSPKSKDSNRSIPMTRELLKIVGRRKRFSIGSDYVLTDSPVPIEPRTYRNHYNRLMKKLGIPKLKFHGLRHSFATRCIESRCDYKTVSAILGHSNISTTLNLYVHPDMDQKKRCIEQMARQLK